MTYNDTRLATEHLQSRLERALVSCEMTRAHLALLYWEMNPIPPVGNSVSQVEHTMAWLHDWMLRITCSKSNDVIRLLTLNPRRFSSSSPSQLFSECYAIERDRVGVFRAIFKLVRRYASSGYYHIVDDASRAAAFKQAGLQKC